MESRGSDRRPCRPGTVSECSVDATACFLPASLEPGDSASGELVRRLQARGELLELDPVPGSAVFVCNAIRLPCRKASSSCEAHSKRRCREPSCRSGRTEFAQKDKYSFFLIDRPAESDTPDESNILESLIELRALLTDNRLTMVSISTHGSFRLGAWRKFVRAVFFESGITVSILRGDSTGPGRPPRDPTETVVVQGGKSFADTLKSIKVGINPEPEGFQIAGVRSGKSGQVLVTLKGDSKRAAMFTSLVNRKIEGVNAILGSNPRRTKKLHFRQIEGDATASDIVLKHPGTLAEEVQVRAVRPTFSGRLNATVTTTTDVANRLLRDKFLKIGWSTCSIVEREEALLAEVAIKMGESNNL